MEQKVYFQNSKGSKLCGILNNPTKDKDKPIIILVHGHSSNKNTKSFSLLRELIKSKGISTFRIDLSGHGESGGKFEEATVSLVSNDILSSIIYLKSQGYKKIGLVGSSFGGIASTIAASKTNDLSFLVLKSPVSDYADLYRWRGLNINEWKKKGIRDYPTKTGMLKQNYSFYEDAIVNTGYKAAPNIKIPTLIVHGDNDKEVPTYQSVKLAKIIPNNKFVIVKGSDHTYTNPKHMKEMSEAIANFIYKQIKTK